MSRNPFLRTDQGGIFYSAPLDIGALTRAATAANLELSALRFPPAGSLHEALIAWGKALKFPEWYGANLDALHDCLTDPDWHQNTGPVLCMNGLSQLQEKDAEAFSRLLDVLHSVVEVRREDGRPIWIVIDAPTPEAAPLAAS